MSHYKLLSKLLRLGTPVSLVKILANWYAAQSMQIKWDNSLSEPFNVCNGVRQGSVLSPCLLKVDIDNLLGDLRNSDVGAKIGNMFLRCSAYADDFLLISCTAASLQNDGYCVQYAIVHHMKINGKKSSVIGDLPVNER